MALEQKRHRKRAWLVAVLSPLLLIAVLIGWALVGTIGLEPPVPAEPPQAGQIEPGSFTLSAEPPAAPIDQPVAIRLGALQAGENVILRSRTDDAKGVTFTSWARFTADENGEIDLSSQAPLEGTYKGVDSSGLLWSMVAPDNAPFITSSSWEERTVTLTAETASGVQTTSLIRRYPWTGTERLEVGAPGLVAELTVPTAGTGTQDHPPLGVIVLLSGWGDGPAPLKAAMLAAHGYAVLNVGYHHWAGTPERLVEIPVETVMRAIDWIEQNPRLDATRIGIYGTSKGAELALLAAIHDPRLAAVAAWVPPSAAFAGIDFRDPNPGSSWTLDGRPLPYPSIDPGLPELRNALRFLLKRPLILRPSYARALAHAPAEAFLEVEKISAPLLLVSGGDDQMWPSGMMADQIAARLRKHGSEKELINLVYAGAGHGISSGLWPTGGRRSVTFHRGGSPGEDHRAGQAAWAAMLDFFGRHLGAPAGGPLGAQRADAASTSLKIMSFNIEWGGTHVSFDNVAEAIRRSGADIVAIQEAEGNLQRLAAALGWHHDGPGYLVSRFPLVEPPGANGQYVLAEVAAGEVVAVANVHLPSDPYGPDLLRDGASLEDVLETERSVRLSKIQPQLAVLPGLAAGGMPVFLCGDFNSPAHTDWIAATVNSRPFLDRPVDWPVSRAVAAAGFRDSWRVAHPDPLTSPGLTWWAARPPLALYAPGHNDPQDRIDFIWYAGPVRILNSKLAGEKGGPEVSIDVMPWPSDHRAVVSEFAVVPADMPDLVSTSRRVFHLGEAVEIRYHLTGTKQGNLIVAGPRAGAAPVIEQQLTGSGRFAVAADRLNAGHYRLILDITGGGSALSDDFWVLDSNEPPTVNVAGDSFAVGRAIAVSWRNAPGNRNDYIAVYPSDVQPAYEGGLAWAYLGALPQGRLALNQATSESGWPLAPGTYVIRLMKDDGYEQLAESAIFSVKTRSPGSH